MSAESAALEAVFDGSSLGDEGLTEVAGLLRALGEYRTASSDDKAPLASRVSNRHSQIFIALGRALGRRPLVSTERMFLRTGGFVQSLLGDELAAAVDSVVDSDDRDGQTWYVDEWLRAVATGELGASTTDESTTGGSRHKSSPVALREARADMAGGLDAFMTLLQRMEEMHGELRDALTGLLDAGDAERAVMPIDDQPPADVEDQLLAIRQKRANCVSKLLSQGGKVSALDRMVAQEYRKYLMARGKVGQLAKEEGEEDVAAIDTTLLMGELEVVRQMMKMCVGPRGNTFPILMREMVRGPVEELVNTRQRVTEELARVEAVDPGLFIRRFKGADRRIVPHVVIVPVYGMRGICWEPWPRENKGLPGRVVVPLVADRTPNRSVATALGAYRWQVAKEQAMHYWMEEGLTGQYYQLHIKDRHYRHEQEFIAEYVLWVTEEAEGRPKLDSETRALFWRVVPFSPERKQELAQLAVFRNLLEKDGRRATSRIASLGSGTG